MNYIKGWCRTSLDDYNCEHVKLFVAVPRIGDKVTVLKHGKKETLKVVSITHTAFDSVGGEPYIIVELNN